MKTLSAKNDNQSFPGALKNFRKLHRKTFVLESHFNKVASSNTGACEICEIFENIFFYRTLPVASFKLKYQRFFILTSASFFIKRN